VKVSKTGSGSSVKKAGGAQRNYGPSKNSPQKAESTDYVDSVELSDAAQQASGADQVEAIQSIETTADGPMPDPYETSRKMLEKELKRVFKATYLTDGAKNEKYYDQR
jgi:hypothetical protein